MRLPPPPARNLKSLHGPVPVVPSLRVGPGGKTNAGCACGWWKVGSLNSPAGVRWLGAAGGSYGQGWRGWGCWISVFLLILSARDSDHTTSSDPYPGRIPNTDPIPPCNPIPHPAPSSTYNPD